ncbi:hypothetical protein NQ315_014443 [Exocentrus adspersus]|uniref:Uncharacterized protein n=1 Tax=Exocentrus adspersus TaxID=1586481 RepID=A0AAV8V6V4_9CUCU|nr:hypothetical protein NQ315_014443 [Exocentrus adspersus]
MRLDLLRNQEEGKMTKVTRSCVKAQQKQKQQYSSDKIRNFAIGQNIMVRDFRNVNVKAWAPAKVIKRTVLCQSDCKRMLGIIYRDTSPQKKIDCPPQ